MTWRRLFGIVAGVATMALAAHVLFSAAVGVTLEAVYSHRLVDVRRWPGALPPALVAEMVSMFLTDRPGAGARSETIFYGSSFAYGYPWQESVVMSQRYAALRPAEVVLNASVIGADLAVLDAGVLCGARNSGIRTKTAIVELPVVNSVGALAKARADGATSESECDLRIGRRSYTGFTFRHPLGVGWVPFIWDNKAYLKNDASIVLDRVPGGYFTTAERFQEVESTFRAQIAAVVRAAQAVADQVVVFPSPVFLLGAAEVGEDDQAIRRQLDVAVDACRAAGGVVCLDPEPFYTRREAFHNMTHLNQRGHQAIAEWLSTQIPR